MNTVYCALAFIAVTFLALSCSQEEVLNTAPDEQEFVNPYESMAKWHSIGLDNLRERLSRTRTAENLTTVQQKRMVKESCISTIDSQVQFTQGRPITMTEINTVETAINRVEQYEAYIENLQFAKIDTLYGEANLNEYYGKLGVSQAARVMINKVLVAVESPDPVYVNNYISYWERYFAKLKFLPAGEREYILAVLSVSKDSYNYWYEINLVPPVQTRGFKHYLHSIVKSDIGGAIAGLVGGIVSGSSATGLIFGPGGLVLTIAGSAVTGGLYSSGLTAVTKGFF